MNKHLTFDDRLEIKSGLGAGASFTAIAEKLGKSRTTISREVLAHRKLQEVCTGNTCIHRNECHLPKACYYRNNECGKHNMNCRTVCHKCIEHCKRYEEEVCNRYDRPPYVCDGCPKYRKCRLRKMLYDPKSAQKDYEFVLSESRKGISLSENELVFLDELISPCIKNGQSIPIVCDKHRAEIPVSTRTVYSYIDAGLLSAKNLDLRLKLRRPFRKKSGPELRVDKRCHIGRTYEDFQEYMRANPDTPIVEMDSVIGKKGGKVLLTLLFTNCNLQLMFIRDRNTSSSVTECFNQLRTTLGAERFKMLFPVVLGDRGSEFTDPSSIEMDPETGELLSRVFYCDPMNSNQKSRCERNHEFIRYVIPKGISMDHLTQDDINIVMNNINSYSRTKWNGQAPIDLFKQIYGEKTASLLGLEKIPSDSIILKPELLR